jgi:hypothetical protein
MTWWDTYKGKGKLQLLSYGTITVNAKINPLTKSPFLQPEKKALM